MNEEGPHRNCQLRKLQLPQIENEITTFEAPGSEMRNALKTNKNQEN